MSIIVKNAQLPVTSVTASAALAALQDVAFTDGQLFYVATYGDYFAWHPGQSLTAVANVVINGPTGQYTRMGIPNPKWQTQTTWSIDESNVSGVASDENTGIDDAHPLLNIDEFARRIGVGNGIKQATVVRWMSNTTHSTVNLNQLWWASLPIPNTFPYLTFVGVPTVILSGTLTGATDAPWTVSDSSLPVSWTSSAGMSSSSGSRFIRKTDKTKHAALAYESVAKTATTSPSTAYSVTNMDDVFGGGAASFAPGEAYEIITLPTFPDVTFPCGADDSDGVVCIYLDFTGGLRGNVQARVCGFRGNAGMWNMFGGGGTTVYGAIFVNGGTISGQNQNSAIDRCIILKTFQFGNWGGDLNTCVNVVAKAGRITAIHATLGRLGTVWVFDCTGTAIQVTNISTMTIDAIHGSGNSGIIVDIRDSGCSVNSTTTTPLTAFDATTSALHPISVVGTQYDYTAIPITVPAKNASFTTN